MDLANFDWPALASGFFAANAIPHFCVGVWDIRFMGLFGFGAKQNIAYGFFNWFVALTILWIDGGLARILDNATLLGVALLFLSYLVSGRYLYLRWKSA